MNNVDDNDQHLVIFHDYLGYLMKIKTTTIDQYSLLLKYRLK